MRQIDLMQIAGKMAAGQAFPLTRKDMLGCADGELRSAFDGPPRWCDIEDFIKKASESWGVEFVHNLVLDTWTMYKNEEQI